MKREKARKQVFFLFAVLLSAAILSACGNAKKEAPAAATAGVADVGIAKCYNCHNDYNNPGTLIPDPVANSGPFNDTGTRYSEGWIDDRHANMDGSPAYTDFGSDTTCASCHDQLSEGETIERFALDTGIPALGTSNRPLVACESCHGGGGNHFGLGPLPFPRSDSTMCDNCHNANMPSSGPNDHLTITGNPELGRIGEDYAATGHARSINSHVYVSGSTTDVTARCSRCHTDEGAKRYISVVNGTDDHDTVVANMTGKSNVSDASPVQCRTCHVNAGHGTSRLLGENATASAFPSGSSIEFMTCTSCHQLLKADGTRLDAAYHSPYDAGGVPVNAYGSVEEVIADTHYDDPSTQNIEGYIVDPAGTHSAAPANTNQGACRDCHNPHNADLTINRQWARSAHGGEILQAKEEATNAYTATVGAAGDPWQHYLWTQSSRAACQRCHTATGFRNFANNQAGYDADDNTIPDTANTFVATGSQLELLYCWACHTDNVGGIRNPGQITANYDVTISNQRRAEVHYTYPDVSKSNVCMGCHTGRESGESISMLNTGQPGTTSVDFSNLSFINSHYLTAGGTVFTVTGYEYSGRSYDNPASYKHDKIGTTAAPNTGTSGPCVGCHMSATESHLFLPVTKDENDVITAVTSPVCSRCHPGGEAISLTAASLENQKKLMADALEALQRQLDSKGYYFRNAYPYFYQPRVTTGTVSVTTGSTVVTGSGTSWSSAGIVVNADQFKVNLDGNFYTIASVDSDTQITLSTAYTGPTVTGATYSIIKTTAVTDWRSTGDTDTTGNTTGKNNMGAAFNYNLLEHDPGAYAHNRYYAKRLIYDAIDWLDDNNMNNSVAATLNALDATDHPYKANAISYLLVSGGRP